MALRMFQPKKLQSQTLKEMSAPLEAAGKVILQQSAAPMAKVAKEIVTEQMPGHELLITLLITAAAMFVFRHGFIDIRRPKHADFRSGCRSLLGRSDDW